MKIFDFHAPQELIEPHLWKSTQDFSHINTGRFVRNAVLSSKIYNGSDLAPAYIKNRDAIHPLYGYKDQLGASSSVFGGCGASADAGNARGILNPQNESTWWAPGGRGVNAYIYAKLPEATLVETYDVGSNSGYCPLSWTLHGSLDGSTWALLHTVDSSGTWNATYETKTFTVPAETRGTYLYYKLTITASNSSTTKLRLLRLYRAASVCAKGQLLIDASAAEPLLMSFAAGFSGTTPLDYEETLSAAILKTVDFTTLSLTDITPFNVNAVRNASGGVEIELENAIGAEIIQAAGGLAYVNDKGWTCSKNEAKALYIFGRTSNYPDGYNSEGVNVSYISNSANGVYVNKIYAYIYGNVYVTWHLSAIELDNSETILYGGNCVSLQGNIVIGRRIKGVKIDYYNTNGYGGGSSGAVGAIALYSPSSPAYRLVNGKLYERESPADAWTECQKIRLATCVLDPTKKEVFQPLALSALQLQWLTNGSAETYLEP